MSKWQEAAQGTPALRELYCACLTAASVRLVGYFPATDPSTGMTRNEKPVAAAAKAVVALADEIYEAVIREQ